MKINIETAIKAFELYFNERNNISISDIDGKSLTPCDVLFFDGGSDAYQREFQRWLKNNPEIEVDFSNEC